MKRLLLFVFFCGVITTANAQARFLVQNRTKTNYTQIYNNINDAYNNAQPHDTIYVPGALDPAGFHLDQDIDKPLHWIGVGVTQRATPVTGISYINNGGITFTENCSGTTIDGIRFNSLQIGSSATKKCNNVTIKKCIFRTQLNVYGDNFIMTGCLGFARGNYVYFRILGNKCSENALFKNCIFLHGRSNREINIEGFNNSVFTYNTIYSTRGILIQHTNNCILANSILMARFSPYGLGAHYDSNQAKNVSLRFSHCAFGFDLPFDPTNINVLKTIGEDCLANQPVTMFVNGWDYVSGWGGIDTDEKFITAQDFHLNDGVPAKTAAINGGEIGVYGNLKYSYKEIPFYPHIATDNTGFTVRPMAGQKAIQLKMKVEAQSH